MFNLIDFDKSCAPHRTDPICQFNIARSRFMCVSFWAQIGSVRLTITLQLWRQLIELIQKKHQNGTEGRARGPVIPLIISFGKRPAGSLKINLSSEAAAEKRLLKGANPRKMHYLAMGGRPKSLW